MTAEAVEPRRMNRRKKLLVDPLLQGRAVFSVIGIAAGFVLIWVASAFWGRSPDDQLSSEAASNLALVVDATFVVIGVAAISIYVLWITHRFVGPARVIRHALAGMAEGDFGRRLKLRKDDFLKDLAAAAATVARTMQSDRSRSAELVTALDHALGAGDVAAARAALLAWRTPPAAVVEPSTPAGPATPAAPVNPVMESGAPR
jgi:methyl-accepting chemotaxis protein